MNDETINGIAIALHKRPKCMALQQEKRVRTDNMGNWIENPIYW